MKKYANYLTPVAILCFAGSLAIHGAMVLVAILTGGQIGGNLPVAYMEFLNLPLLSIVLPVVGMALFVTILPSIYKRHEVVEVSKVVGEIVKSATVEIEHHHDDDRHHHLKAA